MLTLIQDGRWKTYQEVMPFWEDLSPLQQDVIRLLVSGMARDPNATPADAIKHAVEFGGTGSANTLGDVFMALRIYDRSKD